MFQHISRLSHVLYLVLTLSLAFGSLAVASEKNSSTGDEGEGAGLSMATTHKLVETLQRGMGECQILRDVYRFDCYRKTYRRAANQLAGRPTYAGAMAALIGVKETLDQIIAENRDPETPKKRQGFDFYTPIKPAAVSTAVVDFELALGKAETALVLSPLWTQVHYTRITEVVQSNKALLRS